MKNLFCSALLAFAVNAQSGCVGGQCQPVNIQRARMGVPTWNGEVRGSGFYQPIKVAGAATGGKLNAGWRPKARSNWAMDCNCSRGSINPSGCGCSETRRYTRDQGIYQTKVENRIVAKQVQVPDSQITFRNVPNTWQQRNVNFQRITVPHDITTWKNQWRTRLRTRQTNTLEKTYTPAGNMQTDCNCYSPKCGCVGVVGCPCCYPRCSCAPTPVALNTSYRVIPKTETYVERYAVPVPTDETVNQVILQRNVSSTTRRSIDRKPVITLGSKNEWRFNNEADVSRIPDTQRQSHTCSQAGCGN